LGSIGRHRVTAAWCYEDAFIDVRDAPVTINFACTEMIAMGQQRTIASAHV
jgi:hypothetical protein